MSTSDVKVTKFNNWVAERVAVLETCYASLKVPLDYRLNRKEPVRRDIFTNCFKSAYSLINEEIEEKSCPPCPAIHVRLHTAYQQGFS